MMRSFWILDGVVWNGWLVGVGAWLVGWLAGSYPFVSLSPSFSSSSDSSSRVWHVGLGDLRHACLSFPSPVLSISFLLLSSLLLLLFLLFLFLYLLGKLTGLDALDWLAYTDRWVGRWVCGVGVEMDRSIDPPLSLNC
ncbi:hypothetical protein IWX47DRAFT_240833 [Phyllosticta citricarpa]